MAIIKCPECGYQVSDRAPVCPSCGVEIAGNVNKCTRCGEVYFRYDHFCPNCHQPSGGYSVPAEQNQEITAQPPTVAQEVITPTNVNKQEYKQSAMAVDAQQPINDGEQGKKKKKNFTALIVSFILALLACGVLVYSYSNAKAHTEIDEYEFAMKSNDPTVLQQYLDNFIDAPKEQEEEKDLKNKPTENTGKASNDAPLEQSESTKSEDEKPKIDLEELNAKPIPTVNALTITEAERQLDEALKAQAEGKSTPDEKQEKPEKPQKKARKKNVEVFGADLTIDDMMVEVEKVAKEEPESADNKDVQAEEKFNFDTEEEQKEVEKSNETNADGDLDSENYAEKPIEEDVKATRKESKNTANEELDDADIAKSIAQELSNRSSEEASNNADVEPFDFSDDDFDEDSIITPVTSAPHTENSVMEAQKEQKEENSSFDIIKENADEESDEAKKEPKAAKKHRPLIKYNTKE